MKNILLVAIVSCLFIAGYAQDAEFNYYEDYAKILNGANNTNSDFYFPELYHKFQNNPDKMSNYEVITMMASFTGTKAYQPSKTKKLENRIIYAVDKKNNELAYKTAQEILEYNPINLTALCALEYAHYKIYGDSLDKHTKQVYMIMNAIEFSGDGTENKPYFVVNTRDHITYFRMKGYHLTHVSSGTDAYENQVAFYGYSIDGEYQGILYFFSEHMLDRAAGAAKMKIFADEWKNAVEKEEEK